MTWLYPTSPFTILDLQNVSYDVFELRKTPDLEIEKLWKGRSSKMTELMFAKNIVCDGLKGKKSVSKIKDFGEKTRTKVPIQISIGTRES